MSLINEALKKAQRQRMEGPVAVPGPADGTVAASPVSTVKRCPPMLARPQVLLISGCVVVLLMGGVLAFLFLISDSPLPTPIKSPIAAVQPVKPTTPASAPTTTTTPAVTVTLPSIKSIDVVATPPAASVPATSAPASMQIAPVQATPKPGGPPAVPTVPTANPKVYEFLDTLRIAGIRVSATDPKIIMNDRVFRINDVVDRNTQLRLTKVDSSMLTFIDASGYEYQKSL